MVSKIVIQSTSHQGFIKMASTLVHDRAVKIKSEPHLPENDSNICAARQTAVRNSEGVTAEAGTQIEYLKRNTAHVIVNLKALANEDTLLRIHCCRHKCFPVCPRVQHLLQTQTLCPGHKKCLPSKEIRSPTVVSLPRNKTSSKRQVHYFMTVKIN